MLLEKKRGEGQNRRAEFSKLKKKVEEENSLFFLLSSFFFPFPFFSFFLFFGSVP